MRIAVRWGIFGNLVAIEAVHAADERDGADFLVFVRDVDAWLMLVETIEMPANGHIGQAWSICSNADRIVRRCCHNYSAMQLRQILRWCSRPSRTGAVGTQRLACS